MATLGTTFLGAYLSMRGGAKSETQSPPINAKSKEEESFVKYETPSTCDSGGSTNHRLELVDRG